jgi:hypothetical protein
VTAGLALLPAGERSRAGRDRLELLSALIAAPRFDPLYRADQVRIPPGHPVYRWGCDVAGCERMAREVGLCNPHCEQWAEARKAGIRRAEFVAGAAPIRKLGGLGTGSCRICPERPAPRQGLRLCNRHRHRWQDYRAVVPAADLGQWAAAQVPIPGYGTCKAIVCCFLAETPAGLCPGHLKSYRRAGKPGNVCLPARWAEIFDVKGLPVPVSAGDEAAFRRWCAAAEPVHQDGTVNLKPTQ